MTETADPPRGEHGRFAPIHTWEMHRRVQADYEAPDLTLREICEKHKIGGATLNAWARREGWTMRKPQRIDPNDLVGRLLALLDGQIAELEAAVTDGVNEVAMLAKLVTTLDRVLALKVSASKHETLPSKRVQSLRSQIAERLAELNRG